MDELDLALRISLHGPAREAALRRALHACAAWGVVMPPAEPLVIDFGLGEFDRIGEIEYWIANEVEAGYCGKYLLLFQGQRCPEHFHRHKLETFFIQHGHVQMTCDGRTFTMKPGDVLRVERSVKHTFSAVDSAALMLEVSKPCIIADNYFTDPRIPIGGGR